VVALCEEEGSRFHANYFGSRAILGLIGDSEVDELRDEDGTTLADAMRSVGLDPARTADSVRDDIDTFLELHIEQGPNLVEQGLDIGVVTAITALSWFTVTVTGRADHAGTTPMDVRRDAMQGAARMVGAIADVAARRGRPAVATMGVWDVQPGGAIIVPEEVTFSLDMRHADDAVLTAMIEEVHEVCRVVADELGLQLHIESVKREAPAPTDAGLQATITSAASGAVPPGGTCPAAPDTTPSCSRPASRARWCSSRASAVGPTPPPSSPRTRPAPSARRSSPRRCGQWHTTETSGPVVRSSGRSAAMVRRSVSRRAACESGRPRSHAGGRTQIDGQPAEKRPDVRDRGRWPATSGDGVAGRAWRTSAPSSGDVTHACRCVDQLPMRTGRFSLTVSWAVRVRRRGSRATGPTPATVTVPVQVSVTATVAVPGWVNGWVR